MTATTTNGPVLALRAAVLARLAGDAVLEALLDAPAIHDEAPVRAGGVHAVFGDVQCEPDVEGVAVQSLEIVVTGRPGSAASALMAADRIGGLLDGADLALAGPALANLTLVRLTATRDGATGLARVSLRLRAVTAT
ncbi:tail completion protein gp17 [Salinarimonas soli]|uniref:DUF3168 domain-containing protein n=1 Tax=Salinarimonas soli TaxID=1638099 RepID=A0A5B2VFV7_9HYPH|nr:DUF3168 domain-containing protein [Salinarimonas soli]KAA2237242.1 DUF3168 domain-containing protein [Salinarimonas soli]